MTGFAAATVATMVQLMSITQADRESTTVQGTGCSWSMQGGSPKFAATDGIAIIKPASGLIRLTRHTDAKDLFPCTFTRWVGKGIDVEVMKLGKANVINTELLRMPAMLMVSFNRKTSRYNGVLECGS